MKFKRQKRIKICVLAKNIKTGKMKSPRFCPVAKAVRRTIKGVSGIRVDHGVHFWQRNVSYFYAFPLKVTKFIRKFDDKGRSAVKPLCFSLRRWED